jgi:hypothetical protein
MHPHGFYPHHFHGPSRIFWLLIGAGVATFWHRSHEMRDHRAQYFPCVMQSRRVEGVPAREDPASPPVYSKPDAPAPQENRWGFVVRSQPDGNRDGSWGWNQREWEADRERLKEIQKRTEDAVSQT